MSNDETRTIEDIKEKIEFVRTDIWEISELADDFVVNIRSVFTVLIALIVFAVFGLKPPIETNSLINGILSFLYWWNFICLITAIVVVPLFFLAMRKGTDIKLELISRISLVIVVMISLLPQIALFIKPAGLIGMFIELVVFLIVGKWFVFPGEPFTRFYKRSAIARENLAVTRAFRAGKSRGTPNEQ